METKKAGFYDDEDANLTLVREQYEEITHEKLEITTDSRNVYKWAEDPSFAVVAVDQNLEDDQKGIDILLDIIRMKKASPGTQFIIFTRGILSASEIDICKNQNIIYVDKNDDITLFANKVQKALLSYNYHEKMNLSDVAQKKLPEFDPDFNSSITEIIKRDLLEKLEMIEDKTMTITSSTRSYTIQELIENIRDNGDLSEYYIKNYAESKAKLNEYGGLLP